jgi:hypothetical protein
MEYFEEPNRNGADDERLESVFALQLRKYLQILITTAIFQYFFPLQYWTVNKQMHETGQVEPH